MKRGDLGLMLGRIPYSESGGALQQAAQRSRGCSIPGEVQGQAGWGPEKPELVGGNQPMIGCWNWVIFKVPSNPNCSQTSSESEFWTRRDILYKIQHSMRRFVFPGCWVL